MFCICLFWFVGFVKATSKTTANKTDNSKNNKNLTIISFSTLFFGFVDFAWFCIVFCLCFDQVLLKTATNEQTTTIIQGCPGARVLFIQTLVYREIVYADLQGFGQYLFLSKKKHAYHANQPSPLVKPLRSHANRCHTSRVGRLDTAQRRFY